MEIIAIVSHKYIMHGIGWYFHKSHHSKRKSTFELNDMYFILFSLPSVYSIISGIINTNYYILSLGIGIFLYGVIYVFLHDILVHNRFGVKISINNMYLKNIRKAHLKHHSNREKDGCTNFGFITY